MGNTIIWIRPNSCNSQKKDFFIFWASVVLSVFLRAQNRAFRCFPSCQKSCSRSCSLLQLVGLNQYKYPIDGWFFFHEFSYLSYPWFTLEWHPRLIRDHLILLIYQSYSVIFSLVFFHNFLLTPLWFSSFLPWKSPFSGRKVHQDFVPSSERGRWNAAESISSMSWSGSAVIGGGAWGWMVLGSGEFKLMISYQW